MTQSIRLAAGMLRKAVPSSARLWPRGVWVAGLAAVALAAPSVARADAVLTWNNELLHAIRQTSALLTGSPPEVAREIALVGTAMFDAVNAATGLQYQPYAYAGGAMSGASAEAAALSAGYTAMVSIFSNPVWTTPLGVYTGDGGAITTLLSHINAVYGTALTTLGSGAAVTTGLALGQAAANAVIANRATDHSLAAIQNGLFTQAPPGSGTVPGVYIPPTARPEMLSIWGGTVTPFALGSPAFDSLVAAVPGPPALGSAAYASALLHTQCAGSANALSASMASACGAAGFAAGTPAQKTASLFWNDPGGTIQPPGHWLQIADTVMVSQGLDLLQEARLSALLGMAMNDAGTLAWRVKYQENLWRPITAIRNCGPAADGTVTWNATFTTCDPTWQSQIATPPHPDYLAGHPAFSGAAATVLAAFFGTDDIAFCSTSDAYANGSLGAVPTITLCFNSFSAASEGPLGSEFSRVAGGIHTPFAVADALTVGNAIGRMVAADSLQLVPEPASLALLGAGMIGLGLLRRGKRAPLR